MKRAAQPETTNLQPGGGYIPGSGATEPTLHDFWGLKQTVTRGDILLTVLVWKFLDVVNYFWWHLS